MSGARVVREIFQRWLTPRLKGHLVWIPMLAADNLDAAIRQESVFQEERITHYWDGERSLGRLVSQAINLSTHIAWDIYLLYPPEAGWAGEKLPLPDFWMHQLDERTDLLLDPAILMAEVEKAIEAALRGEHFNG